MISNKVIDAEKKISTNKQKNIIKDVHIAETD